MRVLAPAWVLEDFRGELVSRTAFVEFAGGETCVAQPLGSEAGLSLFEVVQTAYSGGLAAFWRDSLPDGQYALSESCIRRASKSFSFFDFTGANLLLATPQAANCFAQ